LIGVFFEVAIEGGFVLAEDQEGVGVLGDQGLV